MGKGTPAASLAGLTLNLDRLKDLPEVEQSAIADALRDLEDAVKQNPLLKYNHPLLSKRVHPKQLEFHSAPWPRTRLFIGGNRSGKTTATHVDTVLQCIDPDAVPEHLREFKRWDPPFYCRVVGPDLTRWLEGVALQKFREWCPKGQLKGGGFDRGWDKQQLMLRFKNGSWIQFMSNDQDLDKFTGSALHRVVYDESPRQDIRRECLMRLIDYGGEELFGLTPMDGMSNWLYDDFFEPWEAGKLEAQLARLVLVDMDDNPHLAPDAKEWALSGLGTEEREARKTGRFITFSGLIYPAFSGRHVIPDPQTLPEGVELFEGLDPGMRHMAAVVFCYLDHEDRLVVYDELALQGHTVAEVCKAILEVRLKWGRERKDGTILPVQPRFTVIDPAARNKSPQTGRSDQQEYADHGIFTMPGQNDVRPGINRVRERLEADPPRLLVAASCEELRAEFKKYRWKRDTVRSEDDPRDRPVKKDDHCFVAGTLVDTARGRRPIETIRPDEMVWTRSGLFPALCAGNTRSKTRTRVLRFEDGRVLRGTADHPVYVSGKGWTPLGSVRYGDKMLVWQEGAKKSHGMGSGFTATLTPPTPGRATTSPLRQSDCTAPSGNSTAVLSPPDTTSTTSTGTLQTTTSPTLSASRPASTRIATGTLSAESGRGDGWPRSSALRLLRGIARLTAWRGTGNTPSASSERESQNPTFANNAVRRLKASSGGPSGSAQTAVSLHGAGPLGLTMLTGRASGAVRLIERTDTPSPRLAPLRVVANSRGPSAEVFNLTVLGPPEYFANGLLVHNCLDALRYAAMARPMRPNHEVARPNDTTKDRILRHHLKRLHPKRRQYDNGSGPGIFA